MAMYEYRVAYFRSLVNPGLERMDEAGASMKSAHDTYQQEINTLGARRPWGNDQIGQAFDTNYAISADALAGWTELCDGLTTLAKDLWAVKAAVEGADDEALTHIPEDPT